MGASKRALHRFDSTGFDPLILVDCTDGDGSYVARTTLSILTVLWVRSAQERIPRAIVTYSRRASSPAIRSSWVGFRVVRSAHWRRHARCAPGGCRMAQTTQFLGEEALASPIALIARFVDVAFVILPTSVSVSTVPEAGGHHVPYLPNGTIRAPDSGCRSNLEAEFSQLAGSSYLHTPCAVLPGYSGIKTRFPARYIRVG